MSCRFQTPPPQASTSEVVLEDSSREDSECVEVNAIAGQQNERTASVRDMEPDVENQVQCCSFYTLVVELYV